VKYRIWALTVLLLAAVRLSYAQKDLRAGTGILADNNIFRNYTGQSDVIFMPYAGAGYGARLQESGNLHLSYDGEFYLFRRLGERDFSVHSLGADYNYQWPASRRALSLGGSLEARFNPSDYSYYNYTAGGFYLNFKNYLRDNLMLLARYNINGKAFKEFREFNYSEQVFSLQGNLYLESRTTLSLTGAYYYKNYTSNVESLDSIYISPEELPQFGPGNGRGRMFLMRFPQFSEGFYRYGVRESQFPSTAQLLLGVTVAQSLTEGTGLMLGWNGRVNPRNRNRYLSDLGESVLNNEELFDDHYSFVGQEGKIQLKQLLPGENSLTLLLSARTRKFNGRPALDLEGLLLPNGENRLDKALFFTAEFSSRFSIGSFSMLEDVELSIQAGAGRNDSNDRYYKYDSAWFSVSTGKVF